MRFFNSSKLKISLKEFFLLFIINKLDLYLVKGQDTNTTFTQELNTFKTNPIEDSTIESQLTSSFDNFTISALSSSNIPTSALFLNQTSSNDYELLNSTNLNEVNIFKTTSIEDSTIDSQLTSSFDNFTISTTSSLDISKSDLNMDQTSSHDDSFFDYTMTPSLKQDYESTYNDSLSTESLPSEINSDTTSNELYSTETTTQISTPNFEGRPIIKDEIRCDYFFFNFYFV